ncbi:hypothetical protein AB6A40_006574 [Gnathostoma spinigerum]|uniref:Prolylcarboxypeptidase n=1 Tax=Gnathostoma spinigerum TaxID=75299 RepID=A0ABD6EIR7_9BILA
MRFSYYFLLFVSLLSITSARLRRMIPNEKRNEICKYNANKEHIYKWETKVYPNMPLDHFSYTNPTTFKLRYLINTESYGPNGPIFFYAGNEGPIEMFADATGIMWEWAQKYHGAVVFAEHRFYGKTLPFGAESFKTVENLGYLSSEQAIADFADLIVYLKEEGLGPKARESKVFVLGGSYGGMLAAWMRIKYPHLVSG